MRTRPLLQVALVLIAVGGVVPVHAGRNAAKPVAKPRPALVLVRHGESQANAEGKMAGRMNVPLTALGRKQARAVGRNLRRFRFDRAYSSTRTRASDTLSLALGDAGQTNIRTARRLALDERAYGILEGVTHADATVRYGAPRLRRWRLSWKEGPPGGESMGEVSARTGRFLEKELIPRLEAGETILLASHKHPLRALIGHIEGLTRKELDALDVPNAEPIVYRLGDSGRLEREPAGD